jgi:hypothetical protein
MCDRQVSTVTETKLKRGIVRRKWLSVSQATKSLALDVKEGGKQKEELPPQKKSELEVFDVPEHKETKAEAAERKEIAAEQLDEIQPIVHSLRRSAHYHTAPMFLVYFTKGQGEHRVDIHFECEGLEQFQRELQDAVKKILDGKPLWYTLWQA